MFNKDRMVEYGQKLKRVKGPLEDEKLRTQLVNEAMERVDQGIQLIMSDAETKYIKALIDPFHPDAVGVRVPSLNPIDTFTHSHFESFSVNAGAMAPTGKILVVFNPTAIRPRPVVVIPDPNGDYQSFESNGVAAKNIKQWYGANFDSVVKLAGIWSTGADRKSVV